MSLKLSYEEWIAVPIMCVWGKKKAFFTAHSLWWDALVSIAPFERRVDLYEPPRDPHGLSGGWQQFSINHDCTLRFSEGL